MMQAAVLFGGMQPLRCRHMGQGRAAKMGYCGTGPRKCTIVKKYGRTGYNQGMALQPDDVVCFCFHVRLRKIEAFCRIEKPLHASQISDCLSAGTGCGWCRPMLKHIHLQICGEHLPDWRKPAITSGASPVSAADQYLEALDVQTWATDRQRHLAEGQGLPHSNG
ncbi:MAG: (2Fe-2S)-binding protein [Phycisphaerae bacterium]